MMSSCRHGSFPMSAQERDQRLALLTEYAERFSKATEVQNPTARLQAATALSKWMSEQNFLMLDMSAVRFCYSEATDALLRGSKNSRDAVFRASMDECALSFLRIADGLKGMLGNDEEEEKDDPKSYRKSIRNSQKTNSHQGLVLALAKRIPCNCLAAEQSEAKEEPNPMTLCRTCQKPDIECPNNKLMKCGKCKAAKYCSKECQKEDWKNHKWACKRASGKNMYT